jgi:hydroxymethylpyrimidine pyrophosphatase-like HAD family hydrolase
MSQQQPLTIAVDFDGTIVEHRYPEIGREMMFAFMVLRELQRKGYRLILWTFRHGTELEEAVAYCSKNGIEFFAVNATDPKEVFDPAILSRKVLADIYIDDRNVGGFMGWSAIHKLLLGDEAGLFEKKRSGLLSLFSRPEKRLG